MRMALGATREKIYALTFRDAASPVFTGLGAGLTGSILAGRFIQKLLYRVQAVDPWVMLIVATVLMALCTVWSGRQTRATTIAPSLLIVAHDASPHALHRT